MDMQRTLTETIRWNVLVAASGARPALASEMLVLSMIQAIPLDCDEKQLRREFDYLEGRGLISVKRLEVAPWLIGLSWEGVDLVDYAAESVPGIARPKRY